jgi:hypothetical protein
MRYEQGLNDAPGRKFSQRRELVAVAARRDGVGVFQPLGEILLQIRCIWRDTKSPMQLVIAPPGVRS